MSIGTVAEKKPLKNGKNNPNSDKHLESKENCMIPKA